MQARIKKKKKKKTGAELRPFQGITYKCPKDGFKKKAIVQDPHKNEET